MSTDSAHTVPLLMATGSPEWQQYPDQLARPQTDPQNHQAQHDVHQHAGSEDDTLRVPHEEPAMYRFQCTTNEWVLLGLSILNVLAFGGMVMARTWAGHALADTTDAYPVPLAPSSSIEQLAWTIGALTLLGFLMWPFVPRLSTASRQTDVKYLTLPLVLACISYALSTVLWSYGYLTLTTIMSATVWAELMLVCVTVVRAPMLFRLPFNLWFGWISLAFLHQLSAALYYEWDVAFFGSTWWSLAALLSLVAVAFTWGSLAGESDPSFQAAIALACIGIAQRSESPQIVAHGAYVCALLAGGHAAICLILAFSRRNAAKSENYDEPEPLSDEELALCSMSTDDDDQLIKGDNLPSAPYLALPADEQHPVHITAYQPVPPFPIPAPSSLSYPSSFVVPPTIYYPVVPASNASQDQAQSS